jgi:nicotinate-nucleotide adenylyltransferase
MEFFRRAEGRPGKLGILAGTFNPPTRAHLALARAGLAVIEEVLFVLPRVFPHKDYEGASFEDRLRMLEAALSGEPRCSIGSTQRGLFIDIARECRDAYGEGAELFFLCGRDAAERILNWDYGRPGAILDQLREYQLLVAPRRGSYAAPAEMRGRVHALPMAQDYDELSATEVRDRIQRGEAWEHLVPEEIVSLVREIYRLSH